MDKRLFEIAEKYTIKRHLNKLIAVVSISLSLMVMMSVSLSMVQKADATNIAPNCGYVEHKHTAKCYYRKLICQNSDPEHIHDENCFDYVLMCGMHGHIHNAQCFETENNGHFVSLIELFSPTTSTAPEQVIVETASHPVIDNDEIVPTPEPVVHNSLPDEAVLEEFNRLDQQEENVQETQPPVLPSEDETDGESADNESAESVNDESVTVNTPVPEPVHNDPVISTPQPVRQEAAPVDATPTTEVIEESVHVEQEGIDLSPVVEEGTQEDITEAVEYYEPVTIEYLNASPAVVSPMQEVTFDYLTGNASMLSYTIYLNGEEVETGTLDSEAGSIFWTPETAGDFSIRLTAADARGNTTETVTKGTVYQNESKEEWLKKINDLELSGDWCKDIVTVAQSQKGTPASRMSEGFETKRLFTEQNTDDRFLSFILNWVGIPEERLSDFMMTDGPIDIGDIIYIDYDQDGKTDHMAIVTDAADNILHVVEVDMNGIINEGWYSADDELIVSFVDMAALAYVYQPVELLNELYGFSLTFTAGANIPDDAVFNVEKLDAESEGYAENLQMAESVLAYLDLSHVDMFNLSILEEENEIQPEKTVGVTLRLSDYQKEDNQNVHVVHIHDGRSEEVDAEWKRIDGEETVTFDADSFSVYAVCYTVDFHWNVDGKVYDVSLAGGDAISLRSLADMLGLYENSEDSNGTSERFLQSIDTVKFSNEELVVPVRIEEDTTAGRLKEDLGLVCEYSAELSEEQIAAMNAKEFHAPDWVLISLKPFDSAEYLTVTMKSGEVFALQVTDAQSDHEIYLTNQYGNTVATFHIHFYDEEGNEIDGVTAFSASVGYDSNVNLTAGSEYVPVLEGYTFMQAQWGQEVIDQFYGSSNGSDATVNFLYDGESVGSFSTENQNETDIYLFYQNDNPQPGGDPDPGDDPQNETTASIRLHYYDENGTELAETKQITADATEDGTVVFLKEANEGPDQLLKLIDNMDFLYLQSHEFQGFDSIELTLTDEGMTCYFLQNGMYVGAYGMPDKVIDIDYRYTQDQDNVTVHFHYFDVDNQKIAEDYSVSVPVTNEGVDLMMSQYIPEIEGKVIKNTSVTLLNGQKSENFNKLRIIRNNDGEFFYTYVDDEYRGFSNLIGGDVDVTFVYGDPNGSVYEGGGTRPQHPKPVPEVDLEQLGDADGHKTLTPNGDGTYTVTLSMNVPHVEASSSSKANIVIIFDSSNSMHEPVEGNEWVRDDEHGTYTLYNGKYYKLAPFGAAIVQRLFRFTDDQGVTHTLGYDYYNPVSYCGPKYSPTYTRMDAAKAAVEYLAEKLLAKNTTANPDNIEIGFVEFASDIMQVHQPSTDEATVLSWVNACHTWFEETQDGSDSRGATNWDAALRIARGNTYEGHPEAVRFADDDPKYIIFISDGNPTARTTPDGLISGNPDDINAEYDDGTRIGTSGLITNMIPGVYGNGLTDPEGHNFARAEDQAREIVEDDKSELFNVSIFGDADRMQALSNTGYYDGSTEAGMREAFDAILAEASARMGYTNLTIMDGITSMTATTFVNNDPKNFTYKVTDANGNDVTDQRLTAEQRNAKFVPSPLDPNEGGTVTWELGADDFLLDGGTYSVSFVVWPNQASYDLVADLNNGLRQFSGLTDVEKSQVVGSGENGDQKPFSLRTNTRQTVTYSTAMEVIDQHGNSTVTYGDPRTAELELPEPMPLVDTMVNVQKVWNDSLAPGELQEFLEANPDYKVDLDLKKGNSVYIENIYINPVANANVWPDSLHPDGHHISTGLMVSEEAAIESNIAVKNENDEPYYPTTTFNGKLYYILEPGHDYKFIEDGLDYHFELEDRVFHPMVVDGEKMDITFGENYEVMEYVPFDNTLTAQNNLKGGINIEKIIVDAEGNDITATWHDTTTSFTVKASITKEGVGTRLEYRLIGDEYTDENGNSGRSIKYTIADSSDFTIRIHAGDYIRIVNVPSGYEYTFYEADLPEGSGYEFYSITGNAVDVNGTAVEGANITVSEDGKTLTGTTVPNAAQNVNIANTPKPKSFSFSKVWIAGNTNADHINKTDLLEWKTEDTIHVTMYRIAAGKEQPDASYQYVLNVTDEIFYPLNEGLSEEEKEKYKLTRTTAENISTFGTGTDIAFADDEGNMCTYYVVEDSVSAASSYNTYYGTMNENEIIARAQGAQRANTGEYIINKESSGYTLPETGGTGRQKFIYTGILMVWAATAMLLIRNRFRKTA